MQTFRAWIIGKKQRAYIRGIVDSGSQRTFIREDVSKTLGLKELGSVNLQLNTLGQTSSVTVQHRLVELKLRSQYDNRECLLQAIEVPFVCKDVVQVPLEHDFVTTIESDGHLIADKLLLPGMAAVPGISLLIGADQLWQFMSGEMKRYHAQADLVALGSAFGWMLQGALSFNTSLEAALNACVLRVSASTDSIDDLLRKLWELESIGITPVDNTPNKEPNMVLENFDHDIAIVNGRYQVARPWKESCGQLEYNRLQARKRLMCLGKKMKNNPEFAVEYDTTIRNYMKMGHAERVPSQIEAQPSKLYYMPYHAVVRSESTTTRVRVVFDASSHDPDSSSLNEHL
ncbi:hypothetical protein HPB49_013304 [Dermacentor silvarum]|uniref:Uncharacterized protein n=1 Tax=Dermacentor silvarum TaxID=543639 RepID=A0ACB8DDJ5_DERSI|nr:hypothetical protein HPB49_013304 [Dermacentor silvarum]